jgi:hypothetical protein
VPISWAAFFLQLKPAYKPVKEIRKPSRLINKDVITEHESWKQYSGGASRYGATNQQHPEDIAADSIGLEENQTEKPEIFCVSGERSVERNSIFNFIKKVRPKAKAVERR